MVKISMLEFELDKENNDKLLHKLEMVSYIHSNNEYGIVFVNPSFRLSSNQQPYEIKNESICSKSGKLDFLKLREIIEENFEPMAIIIRDSETGELYKTLFLPEAVDKNPYKRKLICETDIDERLEYFDNQLKKI